MAVVVGGEKIARLTNPRFGDVATEISEVDRDAEVTAQRRRVVAGLGSRVATLDRGADKQRRLVGIGMYVNRSVVGFATAGQALEPRTRAFVVG